MLRAPDAGTFKVIAALANGVVIGGSDQCYTYRNGHWGLLPFQDLFWSAQTVNGGALLVGQRGIYFVDDQGRGRRLRELTDPKPARIHVVFGRIIILAWQDGAFEWADHELQNANADFDWALRARAHTFVPIDESLCYVVTRQGLIRLERSGNRGDLMVPADWQSMVRALIVDAFLANGDLVLVTHQEGLIGYDPTSWARRWQVASAELGGNVYFAQSIMQGLLVGTMGGLYVVPPPGKISITKIPEGEVRFLVQADSKHLIGLDTGVYVMGESIPRHVGLATHALQLNSNILVRGLFGAVVVGDKQIQIGGREVVALAKLDDSSFAALQKTDLLVIRDGTVTTRTTLPSVANSAGVSADGEILLGTANGALRYSIQGTLLGRFGTGVARIHQTNSGLLISDGTGKVFNAAREVLSVTPLLDVKSATVLSGSIYLLGVPAQGEPCILCIDPTSRSSRAIDVPLLPGAGFLGAENNRLLIVAPRFVMSVVDPSYLAPPALDSLRVETTAAKSSSSIIRLASDQDIVTVALPNPRLPPWTSPIYQIQIGSDVPIPAVPGQRVPIARLPWGKTDVLVTATQAGTEYRRTLQVTRARPWWISTPAFVLYFALAAATAYAGLIVRTRRLQRHASRLQRLVDARTTELRTAHHAREEFFSTLSHEIRNPLNGVVGLCQILNRTDKTIDPARRTTLLRTLENCSDQLRSVIDDVLDFTKIDRGEIQLHAEPFELNLAVDAAVRAVDTNLARTQVEPSRNDTWLLGDEGKLRQIVTNLVSNALKYGVPSQAQVHVRADLVANAGVHLRIGVVNTGPMIPRDELDMIFSGFVRGSNATRRRIAGTGLGLAVSRRIAQAMGGRLEARSDEASTEFVLTLTLPLTNLRPATAGQATPATPRKQRVLAIEDETYNRLVLEHLLTDLGFRADWAADGASALEKVHQNHYDLILTDLALPDISGTDLAQKIRAELKGATPPIIAVTAFCTPEKIAKAQQAGISAVVTKPISPDKLASLLVGA